MRETGNGAYTRSAWRRCIPQLSKGPDYALNDRSFKGPSSTGWSAGPGWLQAPWLTDCFQRVGAQHWSIFAVAEKIAAVTLPGMSDDADCEQPGSDIGTCICKSNANVLLSPCHNANFKVP